jgi:hypothetical protein
MSKNTNSNAKAARQKLLLRNSKPSNESIRSQIAQVQQNLALLMKREREKAKKLAEMSRRSINHAQHASRALTAFTRLVQKGLFVAIALVAISSAHGDDRTRERKERHESHNWIIERQQIGAVRGVPTSRLIIGKREIDIYPNGLMFEKGNVVGARGGR